MDLNIFIADDDISITDQLSSLILEWADSNRHTVSIKTINSLHELDVKLVVPFDLVILDIVINEDNGISFAKKIRELGSDAMIAFVSNFKEYALEGYSVQAISYLLKPLNRASVFSLLDNSLSKVINSKKERLIFNINGHPTIFMIKDIEYIESNRNTLSIHSSSDVVRVYGTIKEIESQIYDTPLVRCHKRYIVNIEKAIGMDPSQVLLSNKRFVPIGRAYRREVTTKLFLYLR